MPRNKIDEKKKLDVIKAYENGTPRKKIAEQFCISLSSVGRIIKNKIPEHHHEKKTDTKTERQKRIENLEIRLIELEIKILEAEARKRAEKRKYFLIQCIKERLNSSPVHPLK